MAAPPQRPPSRPHHRPLPGPPRRRPSTRRRCTATGRLPTIASFLTPALPVLLELRSSMRSCSTDGAQSLRRHLTAALRSITRRGRMWALSFQLGSSRGGGHLCHCPADCPNYASHSEQPSLILQPPEHPVSRRVKCRKALRSCTTQASAVMTALPQLPRWITV